MDDDTVTITITREEATDLSAGLSDVLCWMSGFRAARPDADDLPLGIDETRRVSLLIKDALRLKDPARDSKAALLSRHNDALRAERFVARAELRDLVAALSLDDGPRAAAIRHAGAVLAEWGMMDERSRELLDRVRAVVEERDALRADVERLRARVAAADSIHAKSMDAIHEAAGIRRNGLAGILAWIEDARAIERAQRGAR